MTETLPPASQVARRVAAGDWGTLADELDAYGNALTGRLLTPGECREIAGLYDETDRFRTTVDMARHHFGSGQYRYFTHDLPDVVRALREAFYPRLLPIARDWAAKLGRPAPTPSPPCGTPAFRRSPGRTPCTACAAPRPRAAPGT